MWEFIRRLVNGVRALFAGPKPLQGGTADRPLPPVWFGKIEKVEKTPSNDAIEDKKFIQVQYKSKVYWVLFRCPCHCGDVISLPVQPSHSPRWTVSESPAGRPSLYPSVWRNKGCMSHFWIEDGRVFLTSDIGVAPWVAKPKSYQQRSPGAQTDLEI